uniref:Histone-lysine N-methyltransferase SMYD3-like n=1 Tax=Saccoglossus kowalevskii TaxID=10224 RepID=A0ABM0MCI6_SACKO|nr:PREDICTED: histone-lysine N-methyltransferase SMYD3-like [Saccoglossus kowalevskii]
MAVKIEKFTSEDRGRGYRTVTRVKVGELVLKAQPFVHVLCNTERGNRCDFCLRSTESLLRCSSCKFSRYCNVKCQRSAWTCHKAECKSLKKVSPRIPPGSVRLMSRILYKLKDKSCESQTITEFMSLQSHDTALTPEKKEQFSQLLFVLNQYVDEGTLPNDVSDLLCIFGRMTSNSFSVCDSEMKPIGVGIYPSASLLNHSCDPNCVAVFNGTDLCIRAVKPISVGDECVISYIEMMSTTSERREHLQDQYYFQCVCHACKDIDKDNLKQSIQCHTGGCNEPIVMKNNGFAACSKCGHQYDKTHHQIVSQSVNVVKQALLKIEDAKKQQNILFSVFSA